MKVLSMGITAAAVLAAGVATSASAAPIVTNGGFESGLTGWTQWGLGGTTPGVGVTVVTTGGSNTTGYGDNVPSYEGSHAAFFVDDNASENISQFVTLSGGTWYTLSFALYATTSGAANPFGFALTDSVGLSLLNINANTGFNTDVPVGAWTTYNYDFYAPISSGFYALNFNFTSGATPAKDVLLDAVNISVRGAVPEPSSWALMMLGLGGIGLAMRRRKTIVQFA